MKRSSLLRIIILIVAITLLVGSIFVIRACNAPPEYSEIEARFKELIKNSQNVNKILFGDGLDTYDRVYEPTIKVFKDKNADASYYYYEIEDEKLGTLYAYKGKVGEAPSKTVKYLTATDKKDGEPVYTDEAQGLYYYYIEYTEPKVEFYYTSVDPTNYKYVKDNAECTSITEIKKMAEKVYSKSYLRSLYEPLFDGFEAVPPVYMENGTSGRLMQYENYESLFSENCVYMFETAEIDTWQSNSSLVRINIKAYLPSEPSKKYDVVIDLALEDGKWYLESPTYLVGNIED